MEERKKWLLAGLAVVAVIAVLVFILTQRKAKVNPDQVAESQRQEQTNQTIGSLHIMDIDGLYFLTSAEHESYLNELKAFFEREQIYARDIELMADVETKDDNLFTYYLRITENNTILECGYDLEKRENTFAICKDAKKLAQFPTPQVPDGVDIGAGDEVKVQIKGIELLKDSLPQKVLEELPERIQYALISRKEPVTPYVIVVKERIRRNELYNKVEITCLFSRERPDEKNLHITYWYDTNKLELDLGLYLPKDDELYQKYTKEIQ